MTQNKIERKTADIYLTEEGYIRFDMKNVKIEMEDCLEFVQIINELANGQKRAFYFDTTSSYGSISSEGRKYMGSHPDALKWRKADAILVSRLAVKILANFYMRFDAHGHPVKMFTNEEKALEWLKQF